MLETPEPQVNFIDFGDNALIFEVQFWLDSSADVGLKGVSSEVRYAIYEELNKLDIAIPYPQRDLHIDGKINIIR